MNPIINKIKNGLDDHFNLGIGGTTMILSAIDYAASLNIDADKFEKFGNITNIATASLAVIGIVALAGFGIFGLTADASMFDVFGGAEQFWNAYEIGAITVGVVATLKAASIAFTIILADKDAIERTHSENSPKAKSTPRNSQKELPTSSEQTDDTSSSVDLDVDVSESSE